MGDGIVVIAVQVRLITLRTVSLHQIGSFLAGDGCSGGTREPAGRTVTLMSID